MERLSILNKMELMSLIKEILVILKPYKIRLAISLIVSLLIAGISAFIPFMNKVLVDNGLLKKNMVLTVQCSLLIAFVCAISEVISYFQSLMHTDIQNEISCRLEEQAFDHIMHLKMEYFETNGYIEMISLVNSDIIEIAQMANQDFLNIIVQIIKMAGCVVGLLIISPILSFWVGTFIFIRYMFLVIILKKREDTFSNEQLAQQEMSFWYNDALNGVKVIKLWGLYREKKKYFREIRSKLTVFERNISSLYLKENLCSEVIDLILVMIIYINGVLLLLNNNITFGELFTFIAYSQLTMLPIYSLVGFKLKLLQLKPKFEHFKKFLSLEEEDEFKIKDDKNEDMLNEDCVNEIKFENISLSIDGRKILSDINLKFSKGEKIALFGENGAGKSTLIDLLLRFKKQDIGSIKINSIDVDCLELEKYRKLFTIVEQDGFLFNTNVEDNIFIGNMYENEKDFILTTDWLVSSLKLLTYGLKTKTGNRGSLLSGGEKQKVLLARALEKRGARVLILDEATSNYDFNSEKDFNELVISTDDFDLIIVITHRAELLNQVDKVLLLENGRIKAFGRYEEIREEIDCIFDFVE